MSTHTGMRFGHHALPDQWLHHGPIHIQPLLAFDKRITPHENGDVSLARRWATERAAYARLSSVAARKAPLHYTERPHMPTPRMMYVHTYGEEGVGDTLGHARRNDLPQPKHAERFRPGRPHSRRGLPWLSHAIRHDPDLRDHNAGTHAAARAFMHRMHARAAKRVHG